MNVILIVSDTLRRDCAGMYGRPGWSNEFSTGIAAPRTPHLTEFAKDAVIFDQAYLASFPTVLARHDILTGQYTWTFKDWSPLDRSTVTLQDALNAGGVFTGLVADTPYPFAPGFNYQRGFQTSEVIRGQDDQWKGSPADPPLPADPHKLRDPGTSLKQYLRNVHHRQWEEDYFPAQTVREASRWLESNHARSPFFLYVDTFDPHEPWDPPQHYVDLYDPGYTGQRVIHPAYGYCDYLSDSELRHCRALYCAEVTMVDRWIGWLLDRIRSLDLLDDTAIIIVADHGFYLGEHGIIGKSIITPEYQQPLPLYPEVARVPMLAYVPGAEGGRRISSLVQTIDLMPTVCEILGVAIPASVQAPSLWPLLQGRQVDDRPCVISSPVVSHPALQIPHPATRSSVYNNEWLLVYGSQADRKLADDASATTNMVDSRLRGIRSLEDSSFAPALYHLPSDAGCERNVIKENAEIAKGLHAGYVAFLEARGVPEDHLKFFRQL